MSNNLLVKVSGNSMNNLFKNGDVVLVSKCKKYNFGDVIVFKYGDKYIIHRIIFNLHFFKLQAGDNSDRCSFINSKNIIGKVIAVIDNGIININKLILNKKCGFINLILIVLISVYKSRMNLIRHKVMGNFYLNMVQRRNFIQSGYFTK